jgi:3-oxoadipate enol-lactonase
MPHLLTNGIDTYFEARGEGPAVVLVHGHSADQAMWNYQVDDLVAAGFRVVRYDVRGHGRSSAPPAGYTWRNYARDLAALLDGLGIASAHLVGSSMGGAIALTFALLHPGRTLSVVPVNSALPGFTYSPDFSDEVQRLVAAVRDEGAPKAFKRLWLTHPIFEGVRRLPDRFAELRQVMLAYRATEYRADYPGEPGDVQLDLAARLHEITAPALVVVGEHDIADFQLIAEITASAMPNARKVVIEGTWHLPNVEKPEVFNPVLIEFLRTSA